MIHPPATFVHFLLPQWEGVTFPAIGSPFLFWAASTEKCHCGLFGLRSSTHLALHLCSSGDGDGSGGDEGDDGSGVMGMMRVMG